MVEREIQFEWELKTNQSTSARDQITIVAKKSHQTLSKNIHRSTDKP
jgi:hypothetical protein